MSMTEDETNAMIDVIARHVFHNDVGFLVDLADNDEETVEVGIGYTYNVADINEYHDEIWARVEEINHSFKN